MIFRQCARVLCAAVIAGLAFTPMASAQSKQPTPAAMLMAKELTDILGINQMLAPAVRGAIESRRLLFLQTNPNLAGDLNAVAAKLNKELEPRLAELQQIATRIYAEDFTEQELKDALAFYKTSAGQKLASQKTFGDVMKAGSEWSDKLATEVDTKFRAEMKARGHNMI